MPAGFPMRREKGAGRESITQTRDFTLEKYRQLCLCLRDHGFSPVTLSRYLSEPDTGSCRYVILRHDVDISPAKALRMAILERDLDIQASYYFRYPSTFHPPTIRTIASLGHEVGYHYEVLTRTRGDESRAVRLFGEELAAFRVVSPVATVAAHGGSRSVQDNRDIWNRCRFQDFGLVGEAYLSIPRFLYFSDTGRTWSPRHKVRDAIRKGRPSPPHITTTDSLMEWISGTGEVRLSLNAHPARWAAGPGEEAIAIGQDLLYNLVKGAIRSTRPERTVPGESHEPEQGASPAGAFSRPRGRRTTGFPAPHHPLRGPARISGAPGFGEVGP